MTDDERKELRQQIRTLRQQLSEQQRSLAATALSQHFLQASLFQDAEHIACYMANDGEMDPNGLMQQAWQLGKKTYLPVLNPEQPNHLVFFSYQDGDSLQTNRYGIPEPTPSDDKRIAPQNLDIVLTPLVVFDNLGNRLGMGAGYYDRTFAFVREQHPQKPHLIGLAYEFQKVDHVPTEWWDVPLWGIITDKNIYPAHLHQPSLEPRNKK